MNVSVPYSVLSSLSSSFGAACFFLSVLIVVYTIGELFHKLWCKQKSLIIKIGIHIKISCVTVKLLGVLLYVTLEQVFFSVFLFTVMSLYDFCHHHRYP